jgi:hypothetical protein
MLPLTVGLSASGATGAELLAVAAKCETAANGIEGVRSAKARLNAVVDGRAKIVVECLLDSPATLGTARPLLIAALADAASTPERPVLGVS